MNNLNEIRDTYWTPLVIYNVAITYAAKIQYTMVAAVVLDSSHLSLWFSLQREGAWPTWALLGHLARGGNACQCVTLSERECVMITERDCETILLNLCDGLICFTITTVVRQTGQNKTRKKKKKSNVFRT